MVQNENPMCALDSTKDLCNGRQKIGHLHFGARGPPLSDRLTGVPVLIHLSQSLEGICFVSMGYGLSIEEVILPL